MDKKELRKTILDYYWMTCYPNADYKEFTDNWLKVNGNEEFVDGLIDKIIEFNARTTKAIGVETDVMPKIAGRGYIIIAIDVSNSASRGWNVCVKVDGNRILKGFAPTPATIFTNYKDAYNTKRKFERHLNKTINNTDQLLIIPVASNFSH